MVEPDIIQERGLGKDRGKHRYLSQASWSLGQGYDNVPVLNLTCEVRPHLVGQGELWALRAQLSIVDSDGVREIYSSLQQILGQESSCFPGAGRIGFGGWGRVKPVMKNEQ